MKPKTIWVGSVYVATEGDDVHDLCLDLTGDTDCRFFIDTAREFIPLRNYLHRHPERRPDVVSVLSQRLR